MKQAMLPLPGPRVMDASVSCLWVVRVNIHAPFGEGRLVVRDTFHKALAEVR